MKKVEKYIYIVVIIIAVAALASGITYLVVSKDNDNSNQNNNNNNETITDGVKQKQVYNLNDKIIEELEITLNGNKKTMKIEYTYDYNSETLTHTISGNFNKANLYNKELIDIYNHEEDKITQKYDKTDIYTSNIIESNFDEESFKIIKGTDNKNYLIVIAKSEGNYSNNYDAYVFNQNLELISENAIEHDYYIAVDDNRKYDSFNLKTLEINIVTEAEGLNWYDNTYCSSSDYLCHTIFKIEDNKIYYLALKLNENLEEGNYGILEERVYTINNSKLEYEVINTYKVTEMANLI